MQDDGRHGNALNVLGCGVLAYLYVVNVMASLRFTWHWQDSAESKFLLVRLAALVLPPAGLFALGVLAVFPRKGGNIRDWIIVLAIIVPLVFGGCLSLFGLWFWSAWDGMG